MHFFKKLLLIMHVTAVFILVASFAVSAGGFSQRVTLSQKDSDLRTIFSNIKSQTGYTFTYADDLDFSKRVSVNFIDVPVDQALGILLKDQPFAFSIIDKNDCDSGKGEDGFKVY